MYTQHAEKRCQQRGIKQDVVDTLLSYGRCGRHLGADIYYMDGQSRRDAKLAMGERGWRKIVDKMNAYLVVSDEGTIITAAKRTQRLKFH